MDVSPATDYSANADIWQFRCDWPREKQRIKGELHVGNYRFSLLSRITLKDGEETDLWSASDALVLKALSLALADRLPVSRRCTQVKGNGGAKYAVRQVSEHLSATATRFHAAGPAGRKATASIS